MGTKLLAMLKARPILAVLKPRVLQMLGIVLGIIQQPWASACSSPPWSCRPWPSRRHWAELGPRSG
jgi:hypothetical protein